MRLVAVGERLFPETALAARMSDVLLERVERAADAAPTGRRLMRAVAEMRTPSAHQAVLAEAARRLAAHETASTCGPDDVVVARFPSY